MLGFISVITDNHASQDPDDLLEISECQIFDKLCQSFGSDVLQVLFNSAEGVANCPPENIAFELMRFILDQTIAVIAFNILYLLYACVLEQALRGGSMIIALLLLDGPENESGLMLLTKMMAITLSTCIVAHNNALLALLVSNNFAEIKSNVFKRVSKDNLHSLVYHALCKQTLDTLSEDDDGKTLDFIPLAPACVTLMDLYLVSHDVHDACYPEDNGGHGPPPPCPVVHKKVLEEEKTPTLGLEQLGTQHLVIMGFFGLDELDNVSGDS
ncbi:hypothetical protein ACLOJK_003886 [Asimina triloba]